jgi:hypothetical protein
MRIKFIKDATYDQLDKSKSREYKAGEEYDVADDHGARWIRRQIAFEVSKKRAEAKTVEPKEEPKAETKPEAKGK